MEIEKWRVLVSAIECGSFASAAVMNNYTVSGISRIIASLESEVGFQLLIRGKKGVKPTNECTLLLKDIKAAIMAEDSINNTIMRIKGFDAGSLVIGTSYSSSYRILSSLIAQFVKRYPSIKVSMLWGNKTELSEALLSRELDIAVTTSHANDSDKLIWLPFFGTRIVALVPSEHPAAKQESFALEDLMEYPYIDINPGFKGDVREMLGEAGIRPNTKYTTSDSIAALTLVEAGLGITLLIESQVPSNHKGITILPLEPANDIEIGLYFLKKSSLITNRFLSFISKSSGGKENDLFE